MREIKCLALGNDASTRKPHDMTVLKRIDIATLRQGATTGQKVLYIWDRAGIDFKQWHNWKHNSGIYFLSRSKSNMRLDVFGVLQIDREDTVNAGVIADELVGNQSGTSLRRVTYCVPETGEEMVFLTNLSNRIPPGVIAHLYFMRWRVEKSFDEIKNKLHEMKAWGLTEEAKNIQAAFITLAYNLSQLLHERVVFDQNEDDPGRPHRDYQSEKKCNFPPSDRAFSVWITELTS